MAYSPFLVLQYYSTSVKNQSDQYFLTNPIVSTIETPNCHDWLQGATSTAAEQGTIIAALVGVSCKRDDPQAAPKGHQVE